MSIQSESRAGAILSSSQSATDMTTCHQSRLESHQPQSPCERTARAVQTKKEKLSSSNRISFQDTPVCSSSAQRNLILPSHNTPYALYNCSAPRLGGFPYRDSLWEAQLKDQPYGRRSYELDRSKESTPGRPNADSTRSLSNEGDGSLDSSDADLDLTVELPSPNTSCGTPGDFSHLAACSTHSCTGKADFTSISIVNSSVSLPGPLTNVGSSTPETHQVLPHELPLDELSPQVPSSPSEMPYASWLESPPAHAHVTPAVDPTMTLKTAPVSPNLSRSCANAGEVASASQARCGCSAPQGYSHNPTPPIGLGLSLSRPKPVVTRRARIASETLEVPLTPALIHEYEENDIGPVQVFDNADTFYRRKELCDHGVDPYAKHQASLKCRRSIGAESLRIVVEQNKNNQGRPLTLQEPRLTSPSSPAFTNSPASLVVALCSPHLSTAPTSPSIYSPDELHLSPRSEGKFGSDKLLPGSTFRRGGNVGGGWQALNDFFTSRATPQPSSRPFSTHKAHTEVLPLALPSPGPIGSAPRLRTSWASSNAIESLAESVGDLQDDVEQHWIHDPRRLTSNQSHSSPSWVSRRTSNPRSHPIPTIDEDREPARRTRTSTSLIFLSTDTTEDPKDGCLPISSKLHVADFNPERRGRTTSVPFLAISPPEEVEPEARDSPRRSSWQHQRMSSAHPITNSWNHHFRQTSVPLMPRQRLGCNVGGLPTISAAENERRCGIEISFGTQPLRRTVEDHEPQARPTSRFSDSESSMVLVEAESDHIHRIRLGQQRSSALKPILMKAVVHPEATSVVKGRRSNETTPVVVSQSRRLSNLLLDSIKQALPTEKTGPHRRCFFASSTPAYHSPAHSWPFVTMLEQAEPAAVAFWLGCILGPWFFILGGWYLSARRGELGRAVTRPRLPIRNQNLSNGNTEPSTPCGLSWVLANRVAACITGPIVIGVFVWSLTLVSNV